MCTAGKQSGSCRDTDCTLYLRSTSTYTVLAHGSEHTLNCTLCVLCMCLLYLPRPCAGFAGALPVIIEPSSRWYELCMYTTPITIHMIFRHLQLNKFIPTTENFSVFFFATSMMVIMRAYELQRDIIPPWMVSFLNILLR